MRSLLEEKRVNINYDFSGSNDYLIIDVLQEDILIENYTETLTNKHVEDFLDVRKVQINNQVQLYYNITNMFTLSQLLLGKSITRIQLISLLNSISTAFENIEKNNLNKNGIILDRRFIYMENLESRPKFLCAPFYNNKDGFKNLSYFLLELINDGIIIKDFKEYISLIIKVCNSVNPSLEHLKKAISMTSSIGIGKLRDNKEFFNELDEKSKNIKEIIPENRNNEINITDDINENKKFNINKDNINQGFFEFINQSEFNEPSKKIENINKTENINETEDEVAKFLKDLEKKEIIFTEDEEFLKQQKFKKDQEEIELQKKLDLQKQIKENEEQEEFFKQQKLKKEQEEIELQKKLEFQKQIKENKEREEFLKQQKFKKEQEEIELQKKLDLQKQIKENEEREEFLKQQKFKKEQEEIELQKKLEFNDFTKYKETIRNEDLEKYYNNDSYNQDNNMSYSNQKTQNPMDSFQNLEKDENYETEFIDVETEFLNTNHHPGKIFSPDNTAPNLQTNDSNVVNDKIMKSEKENYNLYIFLGIEIILIIFVGVMVILGVYKSDMTKVNIPNVLITVVILTSITGLLYKLLINNKDNSKTENQNIRKKSEIKVDESYDEIVREGKEVKTSKSETIKKREQIQREQDLLIMKKQSVDDTEYVEENKNPYLEVNVDGSIQKIYITKPSFILGRFVGRVDYVCQSNKVGKMHAEIISRDRLYFINDLNSKNGTYINSYRQRIISNIDYPIDDGDIIILADVEFKFHLN